MDIKKPTMTGEQSLAAIKARPDGPQRRRFNPPAEHPWQFTNQAFNRMLDRGDEEFIDDIRQLIEMLLHVLPLFRGKPYTNDELWEAAVAAKPRDFNNVYTDLLRHSYRGLFIDMIEDVTAGTYKK